MYIWIFGLLNTLLASWGHGPSFCRVCRHTGDVTSSSEQLALTEPCSLRRLLSSPLKTKERQISERCVPIPAVSDRSW